MDRFIDITDREHLNALTDADAADDADSFSVKSYRSGRPITRGLTEYCVIAVSYTHLTLPTIYSV